MSDLKMKKRKHLLFLVAATILLVVATRAALPSMAKRYFIFQAEKRGWSAAVVEVRVGWLEVWAKGVSASNADGTKQVRFDELRTKLNEKLELESVEVKGGTVSVLGPWKEKKGEQSKGKMPPIKASDINIDWEAVGGEGSSLHAKLASVEISDGLKASAQSVALETKLGRAEASLVSLIKNSDGISASAANVAATIRNARMDFSDVTVRKLIARSDYVSAEVSARSARLPRELTAAGVSAHMTANIDAARELKVRFDIELDSVTGHHGAIADKMVEASRMSAEGSFEAKAAANWKLDAATRFGAAVLNISASRNGDAWAVAGNMEWTPCQAVLEAIPAAMRPDLEGIEFSGDMRGSFSVSLANKGSVPDVTANLEHKCRATSLPSRIADAIAGKPFERQIYHGIGNTREVTSGVGRQNWVPFTSVSPYMAKAVVTTEDPGFWGHHGFDMEAIRNSIRENVKDRKFIRGASTIPMQLAKNMFLSRDKTATRKLQEFFLTIVIDQKMPKDRIIEMYLNIIEFGPDIYGIGPASRHYFDTEPSRLSLGQAVFLASILPRPRGQYFNPDGQLNTGKKSQVGLILDLMQRRGSITDEECRIAKEEILSLGKDESDPQNTDMSEWEIQ